MTAKVLNIVEEKPPRQLISICAKEDLDMDKCIDTHWFNSTMQLCSKEEIKVEPYFYYEFEAPLAWFISVEFKEILKQGHWSSFRSPLRAFEEFTDRFRPGFRCTS
jgi:hypothetical protein